MPGKFLVRLEIPSYLFEVYGQFACPESAGQDPGILSQTDSGTPRVKSGSLLHSDTKPRDAARTPDSGRLGRARPTHRR